MSVWYFVKRSREHNVYNYVRCSVFGAVLQYSEVRLRVRVQFKIQISRVGAGAGAGAVSI